MARDYQEALVLFSGGNYERARELAETLLKSQYENGCEDHQAVANTLLLVANAHAKLDGVEAAERYFDACDAYIVENFSDSHTFRASANLNWGIALVERRRFEEALQKLTLAAKMVENTFGVDRLILSDIHHNIGCTLQGAGQLSDALAHYMKSLRIREKFKSAKGDIQLALALTMENVSLIWRQQKNHHEAIKLMNQVIKTRRERLGVSLDLANALFLCGVLNYEVRRDKVAQSLFRKCYEIRSSIVGKDHFDALICTRFFSNNHEEAASEDTEPYVEASEPQTSSRLPAASVTVAGSFNARAAAHAPVDPQPTPRNIVPQPLDARGMSSGAATQLPRSALRAAPMVILDHQMMVRDRAAGPFEYKRSGSG